VSTTFVVAVVNIGSREHVLTTFCTTLEETRKRVAEMEAAYPGTGYRLLVSPTIAEAEAEEHRALDAILRESWLQSMLMSGNRMA
jgi:hypothetical protein